MRKEYLESNLPVQDLWPALYIAPVKGMAMLRNKAAAEPIDWKEVIVDYGLYGGRAHGQPAKLATIPSFNGQIVSMEYGYGMHGNPVALRHGGYLAGRHPSPRPAVGSLGGDSHNCHQSAPRQWLVDTAFWECESRP